MKTTRNAGQIVVETVCLLYVALFVYAAAAKLLDFEHFRNQIGQSPMLNAFAGTVAVLVPLLELSLSVLLLWRRFRLAGLSGALSLMTMFSAYIVIILNYSPFVPCSCGGILEDMDWKEHLIFNLAFVVLAITAIVTENRLKPADRKQGGKRIGLSIAANVVFSAVFVAGLFLVSLQEIHRNNGFVREYPHHPVDLIHGRPLRFDSYYIAGFENGKVYLGNSTAPAHVLSIDTLLQTATGHRIHVSGKADYGFSGIQLRLRPPYFYLADGTVPVVYKGTIADWKAKSSTEGKQRFDQWEPIAEHTLAVRRLNPETLRVELGILDLSTGDAHFSGSLLSAQTDGFFDSDGMLVAGDDGQAFTYVYYYRNEFVVSDQKLELLQNGKTIDTISRAEIDVQYEGGKDVRTMGRQPVQVNKFAYAHGDYLFVKSDRLGRFEPEDMLKNASIVDVYNLKKNTYEFSFYLYNYKGEKVRSFAIYGRLLIGLTARHIVTYRLKNRHLTL